MSYVGLRPVTQTLSTATQYFNGDGTTLQFTLQQGVGKASDIIVAVGNTLQVPGTDYTASSTALIFNAGKAPTAGTNNVAVTFISGSLQTLYVTANAYPTGNSVSPSIYSVSATSTGIYWPSTTSLAFTASGNTRIIVSDASSGVATSTSTGALRVTGGLGVTGDVYGNSLVIVGGAPSTSTTSGALQVSGGAGVTGSMFLGGTMTIAGGLTVAGAFNTTATNSLTVNTPFVFLANTNVGDAIDQGIVGTYNDGTQRYTGIYRAQSDGRWRIFTNLDNQPTTLVDSGNVSFRYADLWLGNANITSTVDSTTSTTGALTVMGGLGVRGAAYVNQLDNSIAIGNGGSSGVGNIGASGATFGSYHGTNVLASGFINTSGNVSAAVVRAGSLTSTGFINTSANISAAIVLAGSLTSTGFINTSGNVSAATVLAGALTSTGFINTSGNVSAATVLAGALTSTGFINTSGNVSAAIHTGAQVSVTGFINTAGNVSAAIGSFDSVTVRAAVTAIANGGTNGVGNIGSAAATFNTIFARATTAQYADLAEKYLADAEYTPGTVVHFGGEQEVSLCDVDMCKRVAGVVSTQPGYIMNEGLSGEHVVAVALTGRVPTRVTGTVRKGDMMVSAGGGLARAESLPTVGSVIGKALENFEGDLGVIEIVVGRV